MPKVVITHNVADIDTWLKGKSSRAEQIAGLGGTNIVDHVAQDGSKSVAITCDGDVARIQAAIANPPAELAAAMQQHGVIPPLTVYVEK